MVDELAGRRESREQAARERQERRQGRLRTRRIVVAAAPLVLALAWYIWPARVEVEGRGVWVGRWTSVERAIARSGVRLPRGDLLDVRGGVIQPGGGEPPTPLCAGQPVAGGAGAYGYRHLTLQRGADKREPVREEAVLTDPPRGAEWAHDWRPVYVASAAGIAGLTRWDIGKLSGLRVVTDRVQATPLGGSREARASLPKRMALTFDDGPNGETTMRYLSVLAQNGAHATFFLLGDCIGHEEDIVRQEVAGGNEIGNHSWGHPLLTRRSVAEVLANIDRAEAIISATAGKRCRWFRPPYGATTSAQRKAILDAGYHIALWSVDTEDWRKPGAETIYQRIMSGAEPGAIVLCHDGGGDRSQTLAAISRAVPDLIAQGYELVTLSELIEAIPSDDGGVILLSGREEWRAHLPREPIHVIVAGQELTGLSPILVLKGKALLPVGKVLEALGVKWTWDREAQAIDVISPGTQLRLRLDSTRVLWGNRELQLNVPPVLYHGIPLVSAEVLTRAAGAELQETQNPRTFTYSFAGATTGAKSGK